MGEIQIPNDGNDAQPHPSPDDVKTTDFDNSADYESPPGTNAEHESGRLEAPNEDGRHEILEKAANDVYLMTAHLSRQSRIPDNFGDNDILPLSRKILTKGLNTSEERKFWKSYSSLTDEIRPARVDALYYHYYARSLGCSGTQFMGKGRSPIERHIKNVRLIQTASAVLFILTILCAAYLAITTSIMSTNKRMLLEASQLSAGYIAAESPLWLVVNSLGSVSASSRAPGNNSTTNSSQDVIPPDIREALIDQRKNELFDQILINDSRLDFFNPFYASDIVENSADGADVPTYISFESEVRSSQVELNNILSAYLMPLFASALGVCVYLIRESSEKFTNLSFAAREIPSYLPRFILGIVGGLLIGWFITESASGVLVSISPAAIAFLVGYSIELFFNILDTLLLALNGGRAAAGKERGSVPIS